MPYNPMGPYQSMEELYKQAYAQPQRVRTPRLNPSVEGPTSFETEDVIQPGWQKNAAVDALKRVQQTQYAGEDAERERVEGFRNAQQEASLGGFETPVQQSLYERRIAEEKMRQPLEVQRQSGQTQRDVTQLQGQNVIEAEKMRQAGFEQKYDALQDALRVAQSSGLLINRVNLTGVGGFGVDTNPQNPQVVPPVLKDRVARSRAAYEQNPNAMTESAYNMDAAAILDDARTRGLVTQPVADIAREVFRDKTLRDRPIQELIPLLEWEENGVTRQPSMEEIIQINNALTLLRGL